MDHSFVWGIGDNFGSICKCFESIWVDYECAGFNRYRLGKPRGVFGYRTEALRQAGATDSLQDELVKYPSKAEPYKAENDNRLNLCQIRRGDSVLSCGARNIAGHEARGAAHPNAGDAGSRYPAAAVDPNCRVAEDCWGPVGRAIVEHAHRFERLRADVSARG